MALNEIFKYSDFISLPVPEGTVSGDPVMVGGLFGVAQTTEGENSGATEGGMVFVPPVFGQVPGSTGFNEAGFVSVALVGAWAFDIEGGLDLDAGDAVDISIGTGTDGRNELVVGGAGDTRFGWVVNWTSDERTVVRIDGEPTEGVS
jgi:hypothetical protein